ncbi:uncharacterized protein LOC141618223 [Silene latifolia]|uniref:uncharacterized protein LOC141618223 n=1 Tax=Silene latifolia TaxID=37657 RepID=UPI003D783AB6
MKDTWGKIQQALGYRKHMVRLHGVPKDIVLDIDARFITRFWQELEELMGTTLNMSTAFHPVTDGQTERTIKSLEDMLRACALKFGGSWEDRLDLINYGFGTTDGIRYGVTSALDSTKDESNPRSAKELCGLESKRHRNVFHISQLQKYVSDPSHELEVENIELDEALTYAEVPKEILDRKVRKTRNGETVLHMLLWSNKNVEEGTWEPEEAMRKCYPHLFEKEEIPGDSQQAWAPATESPARHTRRPLKLKKSSRKLLAGQASDGRSTGWDPYSAFQLSCNV